MPKYYVAFFIWILPSLLFSQEILTGKITLDELLMTDHRKWFDNNYSAYQPDMQAIQSFRVSDKNIKVKIVLGTWCSDSREQMPVFFKVMDLWNFNHQHIEMIFVDRSKQIKLKGFKKLHITHVPSFIFFNANGKEIGRIIETPEITMEKDIKSILDKLKSPVDY
jgi:thiol-disulfide isomerase/thioredoxin